MSQTHISRLRKKRLERGLSLRQVEEATGISRSVLQRIELGEQATSPENARVLHKFYKRKIDMADIYDPMYRPVRAK